MSADLKALLLKSDISLECRLGVGGQDDEMEEI